MPIDDGIVIINEAIAHVSTNGGQEVLVKGTHLLTLERSATVNGLEFVNFRKTLDKQPGVVRLPLLNIVGHGPVLSMPLLHCMNNCALSKGSRTRLTPRAPLNFGLWLE